MFFRFRRPLLLGVVGLCLALAAGWGAWWWGWGRYRVGGLRINPYARLAPDKTYVLRLWGVHWPPSPAGLAHDVWLRQALAGFQTRYPNVRVEYRLLERGTAYRELATALRAGSPPDVFAVPPGDPLILSLALQVPAQFYADRRERESYLPAAWDAVTARERAWAWPQWLVAGTWLGNRGVLAAAGFSPDGPAAGSLDGESLGAILARRPAGTAGIAVHPVGTRFFEDLMAAAGVPVPVDGAGRPLWPPERVRATAEWAAGLRAAGTLVPPDGKTVDALVEDLLAGRLAVLAGANPWLTARLLQVDARRQGPPRLVLTPVPGPPVPAGPGGVRAPAGMTLSAGALAVFRQRSYRGDDHTRAAVELARFLSRLPHPWATPDSPAMPAYGPAWARWMVASRPEHRWLFGQGLARAMSVPPRASEEVKRERRFLDGEVEPALSRFWSGGVSATALAERLGGIPRPAPARPWWRRLWRGGGP